MIYFLDNSLQLQKIVTSKNVISAIHEHELNGLIRADVELDLSYANKFLILGIDHVGYYYKDEFYLHKIQRVEYDHVNESAKVVLRHIFFEDMIFGKLIQDVRPQNQDALTVSRQTIDANTRWQTIMTDVTGRLSTNFYWQVPYEVIEFMAENYRIEYLPKVLFDGQNINSFQLHLANKIGEDKNIRIPYGSRVLDLKYEEDYSEIITKLVVHGKGEEVGDGYGRRINISDVNFSRNGVESPVGSLYLEDESITNTYGNDGQTPREGREVFEDIEDANELVEAGYQHYLQVSRPQMLFTADVADIGDVGIGDSVMIIRREYDVYFNARIHKLSVDLLYPEDAQVELGDYKHFKESKIARKTREKNNRVQGQLSDRITRLKKEANDFIDGEFSQALAEFEQNLIDQKALIEADRENMTNLIDTKTEEFDANFAAGMAEAERKRQENYDAMSNYVTTTVDTTRTELGNAINASIDEAKLYAEQQAQEKAEAVRTDLETVTSGHQVMLDSLQDNVMSIDDFLGDKAVDLNARLYNERVWFEERINSINTWHYNLLRETQSLDSEFWEAINGTIENGSNTENYFKASEINTTYRALRSKQEMLFEAGETYTLTFQVQTYAHRSMDSIWIFGRDPNVYDGNFDVSRVTDDQNADIIYWGSQYQTYYITFTMPYDVYGVLNIGGNFRTNELGSREYRIKKPYLTKSDNKQWLHNPEDSLQNIEEVTRRVTLLEDGREEFITKTQYDFETGEIDGTVKSILETVDESSLIIQNHEDWILTNGASIERTVDGFESKAWLSDIHNPNMLQYTDFTKREHVDRWRLVSATAVGTSYGEYILATTYNSSGSIAVRSRDVSLIAGEQYTLSFIGAVTTSEASSNAFNFLYVYYPGKNNQLLATPKRKFIGTIGTGGVHEVAEYSVTFTARETDDLASILIGTQNSATGQTVSIRVKEPKLEKGNRATPYYNAFSSLTQRADEMMIAVQGIGEQGFLNQSDIVMRPDYVQFGSQRLDGSNIGALLRVSPTGIDAVAEAMRLSGDLYVDGDITALAVDAIEGNFAKLFANQLTANVIKGTHIDSNTITSRSIVVGDVLVERIISRQIYADDVTSKVGNFIDLNAGNIVTAGLSANVITADHLSVGTAMINKFFATSARIDELITKTHFVNEMHALTLNVVELNASQIRTRLLSANTIEADWLKSGTALLDRVFASTAMFERMMAKSGFVTTLNTVTIDTDQLTIRRPDGVAWVSNGVPQFDHEVALVQYMDSEVNWTGQRYRTNSGTPQIFSVAYTSHASRYLRFNFSISMDSSQPSASTMMGVRITPGNAPSGTNWQPKWELFPVKRGEGESHTLIMDLGRPTFGAASFTFEFWWDSGSPTQRNVVQVRPMRAWMTG